MKVSDENIGSSINVILVLAGCIVLFSAETVSLCVVGALLMAVGLWGLIR
jgi:hypothetical protein